MTLEIVTEALQRPGGALVSQYLLVFTHRRSTAKQGGSLRRHMIVCGFVCLFVNMITSSRLNVG